MNECDDESNMDGKVVFSGASAIVAAMVDAILKSDGPRQLGLD